jgi:hypothetical protein
MNRQRRAHSPSNQPSSAASLEGGDIMSKHERGRDAGNGQFIPVREAERRPRTTVVETYQTNKKGPKN